MARAAFQTARLTLRPVGPQDQGPVLAALNDLAVSGWLSVVPHPYRAEDFQHFQRDLARPGTTFAIEDATGCAGILGIEGARLGYWLCPAAQGKGYATEAARGALGWHFAQGGGPVTSGYFEGNAASAHVLAKLGFTETGRRVNFCRALNRDRRHVDLTLSAQAYDAALPWQAASPRLTFRPLQATDAAALHAIVAQAEVTRQLGPRWPWPADFAFTQSRAQPFHGAGFIWGIFRHGALIGTVGVSGDELGYMLAPAAWGQGYATEACRLTLDRAFASGLDRIRAGVWADNLASQRVLARLGFVVTGQDMGTSAARPDPAPGLTLTLAR